MKTPIIGITADIKGPGMYANYPWYVLRENYVTAVRNCGASVVILPCDTSAAMQYVDLIDGLLISGGGFDIHPSYYGEEVKTDTIQTNCKRTEFEMLIAKLIIAVGKPVLGICGGAQLLNVLCGGSLIQHLPDILGADIHMQCIPKHIPSHHVTILPNTLLSRIVQVDTYMVNSSHHQAVARCGTDIRVNAMSEDGIIEGIEHIKLPFCLGLQWHPEYCGTEQDELTFRAFVSCCAK